MIIVGEKINTSRKGIEPLVLARDAQAIIKLAKDQAACGANYIDVNAGTLFDCEPEFLAWLVQTVQSELDLPLCLDSPNPKALEEALKVHRGQAMVNSISAEKQRFEQIVPLVKMYNCSVVALCMDDNGIPENVEQEVKVARKLIKDLEQEGIAQDRIYLDPLIRPVSAVPEAAELVVQVVRQIRAEFPEVHFMCGLSNVSFGLPARKFLNATLLVLLMGAGLDGAILDPENQLLMSLLKASDALLGRDEFFMDYISSYRKGMLMV